MPLKSVAPKEWSTRRRFVAAAFLALSPLVQAQPVSREPAQGLSGRIGLSVSTLPTYEGSPNRRALVEPDLTITYRSRDWGIVEFGQRGLAWGVGIGYGPMMVVARQSLGERGAKGAQVDMSVEIPWSLSDRFGLRFAVGATWADRDYMQTFFGVTATQAQASSLSVYSPKSGCRKTEGSIGAQYAVAARWTLQADVEFTRLGDVAAASPIVGRRNGALATLTVGYEF